MNVKSDVFHQNKEKILQSKQEFLQIQIAEAQKRKNQLKITNQILKTKIKNFKKSSSPHNKENLHFNKPHKTNQEQELKKAQNKFNEELLHLEGQLQKEAIESSKQLEKLQYRMQQYKILCQNKIKELNQDSLNTSVNTLSSVRPSQRGRKTMSVNLSNSSFNIPLSSNSRTKYEIDRTSRVLNKSHVMNMSTGSGMSKNKKKSYSKIISKLRCQGCFRQYGPHQYYRHIEECLGFMKKRLLEEKEKIDEQIDKTLYIDENDQY